MRTIILMLCAAAACAQTITFSVSGPQNVFAGSSFYTKVAVKIDPDPAVFSHLYVNSVKTAPGVTAKLTYTHAAPLHRSDGREIVYNAKTGSVFVVELNVPAVGPGEAELDLQLQPSSNNKPTAEGVRTTLRIPYRAVSLRGALPPLDISRWESLALSLGKKWCDGRQYSFGVESEVWYYDGGRIYFQLADYFRDPAWEACAYNVVDQYRDNLLSRNGGIQGWRVFPHGLRMAYERTGDESYKRAALLMARNSTFALRAGDVNDEYIRETAYIVNAWVAAERLGEPRHPMLARAVDYLLGHFDGLFITGGFKLHQTFYDGLGAEALIQYYELTGDPRIVPAIRSMLDWIWEHGWDRELGRMIYNPEPAGTRCDNSCQSWGRVWINLVAPAYAWYYSVTGDREYIRRGDEIWGHALRDDISYSGKIFAQNYRWSGDYLRYRGQ